MFRYALVLIGAMGTFAIAAAFQEAPAGTPAGNVVPTINETVIAKNQAFPVLHAQPWVACDANDCSDVPNQ